MAKPRTRAQELGVQPGALAAESRRALAQIKKRLERLSYRWCEADSGISNDADELVRMIDAMVEPGGTIDDAVERLKEPWGYDE